MAKKKTAASSDQSTQSQQPASQPPQPPVTTPLQRFVPTTLHRRELHKAPFNPRQISRTQRQRLEAGIKRFGFVGGIVWNRRTGNLVGGHRRIESLDALNGTDDYNLTVDAVDISEADEMALNILLNNPQAAGEYDLDLLSDVIAQIQESGGDVTATGFTIPDLQAILSDDFLTGIFADQAEAEGPVLDELAEIREIGLSAQADERKANGQAADSAATPTTPPATPTPQSTTPQQQSNPSQPTDQQPPSTPPVDTKADLARKRAAYRDQQLASTDADADFSCTLVFDSNVALQAFLRAAGLSVVDRYFDGHEFSRAVGMNLEKIISASSANRPKPS